MSDPKDHLTENLNRMLAALPPRPDGTSWADDHHIVVDNPSAFIPLLHHPFFGEPGVREASEPQRWREPSSEDLGRVAFEAFYAQFKPRPCEWKHLAPTFRDAFTASANAVAEAVATRLAKAKP